MPNTNEPLTPRETEVLLLMSQGYNNRQIAGSLVITLHTVKAHIAHILIKLGARNRTDAVVRALQVGHLERRAAAPGVYSLTPDAIR